jgi:hypothetical protein
MAKPTLEQLEKKVKKAPFLVEPNKKYLVKEKPNTGTPSALREQNRAKMGGGFSEPLPIPWVENQRRYDTGLNENSPEFTGLSAKDIQVILKDRAELVKHLDFLVKSSGLTETEFLTGDTDKDIKPFRLTVKHGLIVDTTNRDSYLKLFLTMRGKYLMPITDKGNEGRYSASMYQIEGSEEATEEKGKKALMQAEVQAWIVANYDTNKDKVHHTLVYADLLNVREKKEKGILLQGVQIAIDNYDVLERVHNAIKNVDYQDIQMHVKVKQAITKGVIKYTKQRYTYLDQYLGATVKAVAATLQTPEFLDVGEKILK